jgi:hypothetical protein
MVLNQGYCKNRPSQQLFKVFIYTYFAATCFGPRWPSSGGIDNIFGKLLLLGPLLWSSGQSSWLQIRRPRFDSRHYQKKKVVGLERGPLSLVSTNEELLDRKVAAPV